MVLRVRNSLFDIFLLKLQLRTFWIKQFLTRFTLAICFVGLSFLKSWNILFREHWLELIAGSLWGKRRFCAILVVYWRLLDVVWHGFLFISVCCKIRILEYFCIFSWWVELHPLSRMAQRNGMRLHQNLLLILEWRWLKGRNISSKCKIEVWNYFRNLFQI